MGGWSFLNGLFVWGAAAALVPIIIHLVQRRRIQQVVFGSVRFLRKMSHRVVRRRRFTEVLLILLRALALAALAIAFARPFFWQSAARAGGETLRGDEAVLLLIDNSYSMSAGDRLARAKKQAQAILDGAETAKIGVASFAGEFRLLCPIGGSYTDASAAIERIGQTQEGTNLLKVLQEADRLMGERRDKEQHRRVIVLSDFARATWARGEWTMTPGVSLDARGVADADVPNVYLETVAVPRLVVAGGLAEENEISTMVANVSDRPLENAEVVLRIGDEVAEKTLVNVPPRSSAPVRFRRPFAEPGDVAGSVSVAAQDALPADNTAFFSVHVTPKVRVLLVNGNVQEKLIRNDGFFLSTALTAPLADGRPAPFTVREVVPGALKAEDFKDADVVLMANVESVPAPLASALREYVGRGGGVGFFCGSKVRPDEFNKSLGAVAPCKLLDLALDAKDQPVVISTFDLKHEIFREFDGPRRGDPGVASFWQHFRVTDSQMASVIARFSNGQPAMLEKPIGNGRSILLASGLSLEWNDFALKGGVFIPMMHQITRRLCAAQAGDVRNLTVGEPLIHAVPPELASVEVTGPTGQKRAYPVEKPGDGARVTIDTDRPGIYAFPVGGQTVRYAVRLDPREPNLDRLDVRKFVAEVQPKPVESVETVSGAPIVAAKESARERAEERQKLWAYLIGLVLLALGVEMILAAREGTS